MTDPATIELREIERAQDNPADFAPLYERYVDLVWRFAFSRLGDRERAADATAQTFTKALAALPRYEPKRQADGTTFRAWLMMIARNVIVDDQRRHRETTNLDAPAAQLWLTDTRRSPEEHAIASDEQRRVHEALRKLPDKQRTLVELRAQGLTGQEIADVMGMSLAGVRTAHHRAYAKLRDLLANDFEGSSR